VIFKSHSVNYKLQVSSDLEIESRGAEQGWNQELAVRYPHQGRDYTDAKHKKGRVALPVEELSP
jgi:hypothetical protein